MGGGSALGILFTKAPRIGGLQAAEVQARAAAGAATSRDNAGRHRQPGLASQSRWLIWESMLLTPLPSTVPPAP